MDIMKIGRTYKNLKRLRQIVVVLIKYGFEYVVHRTNLSHLVPFGKRIIKIKQNREESHELGKRVKLVCEDLGPTFIKFGQLMSLRTDIFPENFTSELSKLQDEVKPFSYHAAKSIIEKEYNAKLSDIFSSFEEVPCASASISQVHFAVLKQNKQKVIVKVQRPDIEREVYQDIEILYYLAHMIERYFPEAKVFSPLSIVDEFSRTIHKELDFTYEISNAGKFKDMFKNSKNIYIPEVYYEYAGRRVLVMEYIDGYKISDYGNLKKFDRKLITSSLMEAYYTMVFEYGFFHADPHPGNIFVLKDARIGFVDFGMAGRINDKNIKKLAYFFLSFIKKDILDNLEEYRSLGLITEEEEDLEYESEVVQLLERYRGMPLEKIDIGVVLSELSALARRYNVRFPKDLIMLGKTLFTIENVTRKIDPKFNFIIAGEPYAKKYLEINLKPKKILKDVEKNILGFYSFMRNVPKELLEIIKKVRKGNLKIEFEHVGLEPLINEIDKATNRLAFSFIIGALIIGSSIITFTQLGPKVFDLPVYGILGYVIAAFLGLWLAIAIIRSGRL